MSRDGEWGCSHVCVSLTGWRYAKDISEGHSFHAGKPINYIAPLLPYEFVALVQRLHSRLGGRDGYLLSHSPRDERVSRSLRNMSLFTGWSRGFVNYGRFASTIWWSAGVSKSFLSSKFQQICCENKYKLKSKWTTNPCTASLTPITRPCGYKKDVMLYIGQILTRKSHSSILSASNKKGVFSHSYNSFGFHPITCHNLKASCAVLKSPRRRPKKKTGSDYELGSCLDAAVAAVLLETGAILHKRLFLSGQHCFASPPTGFGKSLVNTAAQMAASHGMVTHS